VTEAAVHCGGVTRRVVLLSLALAVMFGYVLPVVDVKLSNTFLGATHLPPGSIAVLLVLLIVVNPLLGLIGRRFAFTRNELLTVYITTLFSCLVPGHGAENFFVTTLIAPFYYAAPDNKWLDFLLPNLKSWFTPALRTGSYDATGRRVVDGWYNGLPAGDPIPWGAWLVPLLAWGSFILASYIMLGCLGVMLRAQWAQHEALAFPLLRLPLEMTEDTDAAQRKSAGGGLFRNRSMWIGAGIAIFIQLVNGLNFYFPDMPTVPMKIDTSEMLTEPPWNQVGDIPLKVWPMAVGITYLLTSEVSFSLWAFYWLMKMQFIAAYSMGFFPQLLPSVPGFKGVPNFATYQRMGAFFVYVGMVLWVGRGHYGHILARAFGRTPARPGEKGEPLPYPFAFWGFAIAFGYMVAWSVAAGIRIDAALAMLICYLVIAIALTRLVVEAGLLLVQHQWMPLGAMAQLFTSGAGTWLSTSSMVPATFVQTALVHDLRGFLLPSFVQSFKLAHDRGIKMRPLLALIAAVILITLTMGIWMRVRLGYENGGLTLNPWSALAGPKWPPRLAKTLLETDIYRGPLNWFWLGLGGAFTYGMMLARSRLVWFPLHPLGYLVCLTFALDEMWLSIFLGWLCKVLIMRYAGSATYRKATPLFLGLVIGDVAMMVFWLFVDGWFGRTAHQLMPD